MNNIIHISFVGERNKRQSWEIKGERQLTAAANFSKKKKEKKRKEKDRERNLRRGYRREQWHERALQVLSLFVLGLLGFGLRNV
jgi:hypothetical protein